MAAGGGADRESCDRHAAIHAFSVASEDAGIVRDHAVDTGRHDTFQVGPFVNRPGQDRQSRGMCPLDRRLRHEPVLKHHGAGAGATGEPG